MTATDTRDRIGKREIDDERRNLASVHQCPHCDESLAIRQNKIVAGENRMYCKRALTTCKRIGMLPTPC